MYGPVTFLLDVVNHLDVERKVAEAVKPDGRLLLQGLGAFLDDGTDDADGFFDAFRSCIVGQAQRQRHLARRFDGDILDEAVGEFEIGDDHQATRQSAQARVERMPISSMVPS